MSCYATGVVVGGSFLVVQQMDKLLINMDASNVGTIFSAHRNDVHTAMRGWCAKIVHPINSMDL